MAHNSSGEDSVRAEAGNNSIDDHTIFNTPVPMVASTVSRHLAHGPPWHGDVGSFLDQSSTLTSLPNIPVVDDTCPRPPSYHQQSSSSDCNSSASTIRRVDCDPLDGENGVEASNSRSSLGILSLDNMAELCSSVLYYEGSPAQSRVSEMSGEMLRSPRVSSVRHKTQSPTMQFVQSLTPDEGMDILCEADQVAARQRRELSQWDDRFMRTPVAPPVSVDRGIYAEQSVISGGINGALFQALGQSEGEEDGDLTAHEVCLSDEELMRFDEEFSDFDVTITTNDDDNQLFPEDDRGDWAGPPDYLPQSTFDPSDSSRGQRSAAAGQGSDGGDRGQHAQGEGQNLDDVDEAQAPSPPHRLDSMYFKQKPCVPHEGGDGEEEGDHSPSSLFDNLEGTNTEENDSSVRQAGEGGVTSSPVPGDGGGGGDGSSGHGSDLLLSSLSPPPMLPPGNQGDTSDMARGLGYLLVGLSDDHTLLDTDDHLEGRHRLQPMGGDVLGETSRHVTFSNTTDIRNRTLSGTSLDDDTLLQEEDQRDTNDTSSGTDQHLASMFLKPTSSDASLAGDSAWSMEQSTFNLGDLCPAGPGSGQVSYSQSDWQTSTLGTSFDAPPRTSEGWHTQAPPEGEGEARLWERTGGNWMGRDDLWNSSRTVWDTDSATAEAADDERSEDGSEAALSDEFMSAEQGLAMLEKDTEVFFEEHVVAQEDTVISPSSTDKLPPGWSFHNDSNMTQPSWMAAPEDTEPRRRISIGTFMASRTEVLGGLAGEATADSRPTFGSKIVTPPDSHTPRPLLLHGLSDLTGDGSTCRGSGVGSDVGDVEDTSPLRIEELCAGSVQQFPCQSAVHTNGQGSTVTSSGLHDNHAGSGDTAHQVAAGDRRIEAGSETKKHPPAATGVSNGHDLHGVIKSDHQVVVGDDQCKERLSKSDHRSTSTLNGNADRQRYASKSDHQMAAEAKMNRKSGMAGGRHNQTDRRREVVDNSTYRVAAPVLVDRSAGDSGLLAGLELDGDLDESSFLNVSTISKMITSSSSNMKADDLVRQILRTSAAKKSCLTNERKPQKTGRVVHSASADSVHPDGSSTDLQEREQRLSLGVEKIHTSEPSLVGLDGAGSGKRGKEQRGAAGMRRRSSTTRLPTPTYQRATVASAGRHEGQGKAGQSGTGKGEQGKHRRRQSARVGESSSSETTPREEALAERHRGTVAGKASECRSVDSNQTTDHAVDIDAVQDNGSSPRANTRGGKQTGVKHKQGTPQPVHASKSTESVGRTPGADGRERVKQHQVNSGRLSNSSTRVNAVSERVNVDNERVNVVSERINAVSEKINAGNERVNAGNAKVGAVQKEERPSQHHDDTNGAVTDGMRVWEERERLPHESVNTEGGRDHTREGIETSPTGATVTDWEAPRASLAASLRLNQRQNGVEPNANHSDDRSNQEVITDAMSGTRTNGGPVESFHHSLLPPAQQRASLVMPSAGGGARPALLTGQALASTPFAVQYLDDLTGVTGLLHAYSDSSLSGPESESAAMAPRLSTLAVRDEFTSLPMSRPSVESQHEYDMRESFSPDVETMFATRMPMHHRNGGGACVVAPTELHLPGVCCVGLSSQGFLPLLNPTAHWVLVTLNLTALTVDGRGWQVAARAVPFIVKEKLYIEPQSTEEVKVIFTPSEPGVYVLQLHLVASLIASDAPLSEDCAPIMVSILGMAENPQIQVTGSSAGVVDFGALPWGCEKCQYVTLVNRGRANVPVRLIISSRKSTWSCFTFGKCGAADVSLVSNRNLPSIPSLAPSVANCVLYGIDSGSQAVSVPIFFQGPARQTDRMSVRMGSPVEYKACVDIEVDIPSSALTLGTLLLQATVGTVRLHVPRGIDLMQMRSEFGECQTRFIPLRNAGNIPLDVTLEVADWSDLFVVRPTQLTIQPAGESQVMVRFEPKENVAATFESLLLMFVEPDGQAYEIPLQCQVLPPPHSVTPTHRGRSHTPCVYSNKPRLAWGGVPIGKSVEQSTILKNKAGHAVRLTVVIRGVGSSGQDFQLWSGDGMRQTLDVTLRPDEEYRVHVVFAPSAVRECHATLKVRQYQPAYKYTIPLSGYGGVSRITLDDLQMSQKNHYWLDIGQVTANQHVLAKVTVRNIGTRAAYISGVCFQDLGCKRRLPEARVSIQPNHFCLQARQTQNVVLLLSATESEAGQCQEQTAMVAAVAFFYGDETSRRQFRRLVRNVNRSEITQAAGHAVRGVNFDLPYLDEFLVEEDTGLDMRSVDVFYGSMRKVMLALIGEPPSSPSPEPLPRPLSDPMKPGRRGSTFDEDLADNLTQQDRLSCCGDGQHRQWWTIKPKQIILQASLFQNEEPVIEKVQLSNMSDRTLCYEFSWPAHCVTLTHERGLVNPRSSVQLLISANTNLRSKGIQLPWHGEVYVTCDGEQQRLQVQIQDELTSYVDTAPHPLVTRPPLLMVTPPSPQSRGSVGHVGCVDVSTQYLKFPKTVVGKTSELTFQLSNSDAYPIRWTLTSVAPPYRKGVDSGDVHRVIYAAFWLPRQTGLLHPGQDTQVSVDFCPREAGVYSQYWEVKSEDQATPSPSLTTYKVEMTGTACPDPRDPCPQDGRGADRHHAGGRIQVKDKLVTFQDVTPHQTASVKVKIKNKSTETTMVEVVLPVAPFFVNRSTVYIKGGHYVSLPVEFRADSPGHYQGVLMLKTQSEVNQVTLIGRCT